MNKKIKRIISGLAAASVIMAGQPVIPDNSANAAGNLLAFPGAVGGGKYATGGRGGEVYHVTNLNDDGAGSFRDAVSQSNRIVVFDVSGTIELKGNVVCAGNVTIAGQTAPGGSGITLKNYKLGMGGDNIICRYISSRPGPYASTSSGNDAWGGAKGSNSIVDHCSMGWTTDEQWGLYSNNENYTVQYSVIGPADCWGGHKKGLHGFGIMLGKGNLSFDHNLIIHNVSRNFRGKIPKTYTADFTNNIIYDWGYETAYGTIGHLNYVNNTLKAGNSTTGGYRFVNVDSSTDPVNFKIYCAGNRLINKDGTMHSITFDNWSGINVKDGLGITKDSVYSASPFGINIDGENRSTVAAAESAEASYAHVISFAGNGISPEKRTAIDRQCADETAKGTGQCSGTAEFDSSVDKLTTYNIKCGVTYTYPAAVTKKDIVDTDNDGMADDWELARGLDPNDPTDYKGDYCGRGYMNIEYYINDLTVDSFPKGVVELSPTEGFTPAEPTEPTEPAEPLGGDFIKSVQVTEQAKPDSWGISRFANIGSPVFGDRDFTITDIPEELMGAEILLTACDAKGTTGTAAAFTAETDMNLYVGVDTRVEKKPEFLADFELSGKQITLSNDVVMDIYTKFVPAGAEVELGSNGQTYMCVNYTVFAQPVFSLDPWYETGDVNRDEEISMADLVTLSEHLLSQKPLETDALALADTDEDGRVDVFDLVVLRRMILMRRGFFS